MTEWLVYRNPDFERVRKLLRRPAAGGRPQSLRSRADEGARASSTTGSAGAVGDPNPRHRRGGLHRLAPGRGAGAPGRRGHRDRQLRSVLSPGDEGAEPRGGRPPARASASTSRTCSTPTRSRRCSRPTPSSCTSPPRRGCGRRWPTRWATPAPTSTGTAAVAEAARRRGRVAHRVRLVLLGLRRQHAGAVPRGRGRDRAGVAVRRDQAGRRAVPACRSRRSTASGVASLRFFTVYGPRQRPDLAIHAFTRKMVGGRDDHALRRRHPGAGLHLLRRHRRRACSPRSTGPRARRSGWRTSIWAATARCRPARWWRRSRGRSGIKPAIEWAPMQPGDVQQTAADLTKSRRGARLRAAHAVSRGDSAIRRLVPGGLWPRRLSACWRGRASDSRSRTTTARCTCWRRSSPAGRAFADVHHLLGVSLSLLGQSGAGAEPSSPARWSSTRATSRR